MTISDIQNNNFRYPELTFIRFFRYPKIFFGYLKKRINVKYVGPLFWISEKEFVISEILAH